MLAPMSERAHARPELLAETGRLADRMADSRMRIVDARSEHEYAARHIAGTVRIGGFGASIRRAEAAG